MSADMCVWEVAPVPLLLTVPMATSAPLATAVLLAHHRRWPVSLALTVQPLEQLTVQYAPKGPCVPPQPLKSLLSAHLVRKIKSNYSQLYKGLIEIPAIQINYIFNKHFLLRSFLSCWGGPASAVPFGKF